MFRVVQQIKGKKELRVAADGYSTGVEAFAWLEYAVNQLGEMPEEYAIQESADGRKWSTRDPKDFAPKPPDEPTASVEEAP